MATSTFSQLSIAPLGAGDLIDRAVRLYRKHFFVLIRIAAPPVIVTAVGSVLFSISKTQLFSTSSVLSLALASLLAFSSFVVLIVGYLFSLLVMGGATRNLVAHLLWNEPVSARATYAAVRSRFWGLLGAAVFVLLFLIACGIGAVMVLYFVFALVALVAIAMAQVAPVWLVATIGILFALVVGAIIFCLFFFLFGRVIYIPQAMMVEGKGVFDAIARSFSLAKGNVRRLMAMFVFTTFAFYSALALLIVPLQLYAWSSGVDLSPLSQSEWPAWYAIGYGVIQESSHIVLAPIWMLGLSLLYVDERVRREGYDIELLAARQLPEMPKVDVTSPLAPALAAGPASAPPTPPMTTGGVLGLH
jgi:MFS family permease